VITYTQPLFVFCLAVSILKEKVVAIRLLGAIMGFVGVVTLLHSKTDSSTIHSTFVMTLGAFLWAIAIVYYKKYLSHVDSLVTSFLQLSFGALVLSLISLLTNSFFLPEHIEYLWIVLYASVGSSAVGLVVWLFLLKQEDAVIVSGSTFIIPVVALFFGWQILGESVHAFSMLASAIVLIGVYLVNYKSNRKK